MHSCTVSVLTSYIVFGSHQTEQQQLSDNLGFRPHDYASCVTAIKAYNRFTTDMHACTSEPCIQA